MVIIMKPGTKQERIQTLVTQLEQEHGVKVGITNGVGCSILGLVGDTTHIDMDKLSMNDDVVENPRNSAVPSSMTINTEIYCSLFFSRSLNDFLYIFFTVYHHSNSVTDTFTEFSTTLLIFPS